MTEPTLEQDRLDPAARSRGLILSAVLCFVGALLFLWWGTRYASVAEWLGEWQFGTFGRYFPSLTAVLPVALIALPVLAVVAYRRRQRRRREARAGLLTERDRVLVAINGARRGRLFFLGVAGFTLVWALGALLSLLALPTSEGAVATITGAERAAVAEGPARYAAGRTLGRVGRLEERVGFAVRTTYVAPVRPIGERTAPIRFFTQVDRLAGQQPRFVPISTGILEARGLPRELTNMYRGIGLSMVDRPYLLVEDAAWLRWRPLVLAVQLGLLAIGAAIAAALLRRQGRRLERFLAGSKTQA